MKKGALKQHPENKTLFRRGPNTIYEYSFTVWTVFEGARGSQKADKWRQKAFKTEAWALKKHSGDPFKKVLKFGSNFGDFWGSKWTRGGGQLRYRETLASQKTAQNVKLCSNNGVEQNSWIGLAPFIWTQFHVLRDFDLFFWWFCRHKLSFFSTLGLSWGQHGPQEPQGSILEAFLINFWSFLKVKARFLKHFWSILENLK